MATQEREVPTFVLCVDNSGHAENAFKHYRDFMHRASNELTVVHVSETIPVATLENKGAFGWTHVISVDKEVLEAKLEGIKTRNEELEKKYKEYCDEAGIKCKFVALPGDKGVEHALMEYLEANKVTGVVMGTRGQGAIMRKIMGSVSHYILHHSHVPVTVCPPAGKCSN